MKSNRENVTPYTPLMWLFIEETETVREEEYNPISLSVAKFDFPFLCLEVSVKVNKSEYVFAY
jgi:hypothetical protein